MKEEYNDIRWMEYLKTFYEKEEYLNQFYEEVDPLEFYRFIFPEGSFEKEGQYEDLKPNGIVVEVPHKYGSGDCPENQSIRRFTVTDEMEQLKNLFEMVDADEPRSLNFFTMPAVSYVGNKRSLENARYLYALVIDVDGMDTLRRLTDFTHQFSMGITPTPTFIVNSGHGIHAYYVFEEPIPLYPNYRKILTEIKYKLVKRVWNEFTSSEEEPEFQSIVQPFRMVGTYNKAGHKVRAYQVGGRITLKEITKYFPGDPIDVYGLEGNPKKKLRMYEAKNRYPEWYQKRIVEKDKTKGRWVNNRALYDWWKRKIMSEIKEGSRYFSIMVLAIYAVKCNISYEELENDAYGFVNYLQSLTKERAPFVEDDVAAALAAYEERYVTYPRHTIQKLTKVDIPENKRNKMPQKVHLKYARKKLEDLNEATGYIHQGRKRKIDQVLEWRYKNPNGTKYQCIKETGLAKMTVYKWWNGY